MKSRSSETEQKRQELVAMMKQQAQIMSCDAFSLVLTDLSKEEVVTEEEDPETTMLNFLAEVVEKQEMEKLNKEGDDENEDEGYGDSDYIGQFDDEDEDEGYDDDESISNFDDKEDEDGDQLTPREIESTEDYLAEPNETKTSCSTNNLRHSASKITEDIETIFGISEKHETPTKKRSAAESPKASNFEPFGKKRKLETRSPSFENRIY
mmetsp:Transcript_16988/g.23760  ORF Transcript_16988/g.23760 Transcript_16988/m.23760 type:complete len:209 (+) Transcript_16988:238-864(+)|eukprot:CAMPEP_0184488932 /NCGR_PEP_ID=MMETSP0113_2-20130426/13970_1 /TAXON_ID=91329 /ORGANISM="Norrisiella sphaerica, Strain BC52" /LENGTH=208 /DNA_ID=CAMNT_0026872073 /DNA_START=259 /DNA_END=885 /DNA_ORIENTATION=-